MSQPTFEVVTMTPEWATELLSTINTNNRRFKPTQVTCLTRAIVNGEWKLTSQGISIGSDGKLLDGQHRLAAIVRSRTPVQITIARNCDPSTFTLIDTGIKRNAGDAIYLSGGREAIAGLNTPIAAGVKSYCFYLQCPTIGWSGGYKTPSNSSIVKAFQAREEKIIRLAKHLKEARKIYKPLSVAASICVGLVALDDDWMVEDMIDFYKLITSGVGLVEGSPVLAYRNYLTNHYRAKTRSKGNQQQTAVAGLIKTFNLYQTNKTINKFKPGSFPPMPRIMNKIELGLAPNIVGIIRG